MNIINKYESMSDEELIDTAHALTQSLRADTPVISMAKLVTELASRLEVQTQLAQQLAAQNTAALESIQRFIEQYNSAGYHAVQGSRIPGESLLYEALQVSKNTATDQWQNELRAQGISLAAKSLLKLSDIENKEKYGLAVATGHLKTLAAQLRAAGHGNNSG